MEENKYLQLTGNHRAILRFLAEGITRRVFIPDFETGIEDITNDPDLLTVEQFIEVFESHGLLNGATFLLWPTAEGDPEYEEGQKAHIECVPAGRKISDYMTSRNKAIKIEITEGKNFRHYGHMLGLSPDEILTRAEYETLEEIKAVFQDTPERKQFIEKRRESEDWYNVYLQLSVFRSENSVFDHINLEQFERIREKFNIGDTYEGRAIFFAAREACPELRIGIHSAVRIFNVIFYTTTDTGQGVDKKHTVKGIRTLGSYAAEHGLKINPDHVLTERFFSRTLVRPEPADYRQGEKNGEQDYYTIDL